MNFHNKLHQLLSLPAADIGPPEASELAWDFRRAFDALINNSGAS